MEGLANNGRDELELFAQHESRARPDASRNRGSRKPSATVQELAQLAELVAERVLDALALPPPSGLRVLPSGRRGRPGHDASNTSGIAFPSGSLLTAEEVAEILGVTTAWIYGQSRAGRIPTVKLGRYYRYRLEAIERWIVTREDAA